MSKQTLSVELISIPDNLIKVIYTACKTCYSARLPYDNFTNAPGEEKMLSLIEKVISSGHYSTIEHIQLTFAIQNVSRACTHQLVRHRHMSFSQKSQRYVKESGEIDYIMPAAIEKNPNLAKKFEDFIKNVSALYQNFIDEGILAEDARSILPNAAATSLVASLNLRELIHLANLRLCTRAQSEIRALVKAMSEAVIEKEPWLKPYLVPKCERLGFCDEDKSCGRTPKKDDVVTIPYFENIQELKAHIENKEREKL